jgi:Skp family chaperone for outer membrane proteins
LRIIILLSFIIITFSPSVFSTNIRVLDFQKIIQNNTSLVLLYDLINKDQLIHTNIFTNEETNLQKELERIEELNLILEPEEFEKEVEIYNQKLKNFNDKIEKFNLHYELQVNDFKNKIINKILDVLKKYSEDNNIDLILDSNNYILSNNSINITDLIEEKVNNKKIEINFEKY